MSAPFFAKMSALSFLTLNKWEVRPASTSRRVALTLTALTSSRETRSLQTCAQGPCTQSFASWPVARRDGSFAERERVHGDDACHGSSAVLAISRGRPSSTSLGTLPHQQLP